MRRFGEKKPVLDERELLEMYRIEHRGLWAMYTLLCAVVVVQILLGAEFAQLAGEMVVIGVVSVGLIAAYARRGIWDEHSRPSARGNAGYSALSAIGVALVVMGRRRSLLPALCAGAAMFALCFALLTMLMHYMKKRQREQDQALEED